MIDVAVTTRASVSWIGHPLRARSVIGGGLPRHKSGRGNVAARIDPVKSPFSGADDVTWLHKVASHQ
eukprot:scaffold831_cov268-Pinguiococcus_pyrenoidosus.AAC.20